ncbi:hypothetical protein AB205_0134780 [Aquarana catesbeiana]|uniref:Uncharacterized protein n=1 Tax=Aquarana catesbeiana TaxID=8400 RepID=A0A2G9SD30_AQUCT|nr:hypothetical protein AB205_0134780 [Aquarana catesbeiana]
MERFQNNLVYPSIEAEITGVGFRAFAFASENTRFTIHCQQPSLGANSCVQHFVNSR